MKVYQCEQGTAEWFQVKTGVPSAGSFGRLLTPKRLQFSEAGARTYACELIATRLLRGVPEHSTSYASRQMEFGTVTEP